MEKWEMYMQIKQLSKKGFNISRIAKMLNISRNTVYKYLEMDPDDMASWMAGTKERTKKLDSHKGLILSWLKEYPDMSAAQIQDWLKERYEVIKIGDSTVRYYIQDLREVYNIPKVVIKREYEAIPELPMGKQIQVDFGECKVIKANGGSEVKVRCICFVLSHSRFKYVEWLDRPFTTTDVVKSHERAFQYFGGMTKEIVYDQDHLISVNENAGDITFTAEFKAYVDERKFSVYLCRKADPETKGKIENVVGYVKKNFARHRVFSNLEKWNEQCMSWLARTGNHNIHNTTKKRPYEVHALEKQHLQQISSLTTNVIDSVSITRIVRKDNTVNYNSNRYSLPLGTYKHRENTVVYLTINEADTLTIRESNEGIIIASHGISDTKGKLIQDRQHTRDRTKGIDAFINFVSDSFEDKQLAKEFLEKVREQYPRYIRDQLQLILKTTKEQPSSLVSQVLKMCIAKKLYSANEFKDMMTILQKRTEETELLVRSLEIKPLHSIDVSSIKAKAEQRDINVYVDILSKGAME